MHPHLFDHSVHLKVAVLAAADRNHAIIVVVAALMGFANAGEFFFPCLPINQFPFGKIAARLAHALLVKNYSRPRIRH